MGYDTWLDGTLEIIQPLDDEANAALDDFGVPTGVDRNVGATFRLQDSHRNEEPSLYSLVGFVTGLVDADGEESGDFRRYYFTRSGLIQLHASTEWPDLPKWQPCIDRGECRGCLHEAPLKLGNGVQGMIPSRAPTPAPRPPPLRGGRSRRK